MELSLPSQLLLRDVHLLQGQRILICGLPEAELIPPLLQATPAHLTFFYFDYHSFRQARYMLSSEERCEFICAPWYEAAELHDLAVVYLPATDRLIAMTLAMVQQVLVPGGQAIVVGEKDAGIKSQRKDITAAIGPVVESDSARHSTLYRAVRDDLVRPLMTLDDWRNIFSFTVTGQSFEAVSLPGVFSYGKLDPATTMLLNAINFAPEDRVLDWGAGSGVIGLVARLRDGLPAVDMVDSNTLAVAAARQTFRHNNLGDDRIWLSDVFSEVPHTYDMIVANPPFHAGVHTNYEAAQQFLRQARAHLEPHGKLVIVANAFLRYRPIIEQAFGHCQVLVENNKYKLYQAERKEF